MLRILCPALAGLLLCTPGAPAAAAQGVTPPDARPDAASPQDSARAVRDARSEQARFERVRRNHLPWAWGGGGGECDERIGRFCLTYSDNAPDWEPEPEAEEIRTARERLLEQLESASRLVPGDAWVVGQRVRYLVEAGRHQEARTASSECGAAAWWCAALRGFALHYAGDTEGADAAFSGMLTQMPDAERRRWTELELVLDPCARREYRRLRGAERERFEDRYWRAADPFHAWPGNEVRSEHFARNVWDQLQDRAKSAEGISWGSDLREILLRFGWPQGWERVRPRPGQLESSGLVSHYADGSPLAPPCDALQDPWDDEQRRARASYSIPGADSTLRWITPLDHQLAVFRRGDSAVVVAAYALPPDSVPEGSHFRAALALGGEAGSSPRITRFPTGGLSDVVTAAAAPGAALLSLEVLGVTTPRAARLRQGLHVPEIPSGLPAVSDLLLLRSPDPLPDSLEAAVGAARTSDRVRVGERIGVYWEVYGLRAGQPDALGMSLRLVEHGAGWLKRLARRIGLVDRVPPVRVRWREDPSGASVLSRALAVQIPKDLDPGDYALELTIFLPGREPLTARRPMRVER